MTKTENLRHTLASRILPLRFSVFSADTLKPWFTRARGKKSCNFKTKNFSTSRILAKNGEGFQKQGLESRNHAVPERHCRQSLTTACGIVTAANWDASRLWSFGRQSLTTACGIVTHLLSCYSKSMHRLTGLYYRLRYRNLFPCLSSIAHILRLTGL